MLRQDERAAWEDAFNETQRASDYRVNAEPGWYGTAATIALGILALWALYSWLPAT